MKSRAVNPKDMNDSQFKYKIEQDMKEIEYEEDIYDDKNEKSEAFLRKEAAK